MLVLCTIVRFSSTFKGTLNTLSTFVAGCEGVLDPWLAPALGQLVVSFRMPAIDDTISSCLLRHTISRRQGSSES
jgi:hypothetical protein